MTNLRPGETSIGGSARNFPNTTWGLISRLDPSTADHRSGIDDLCRRYWKPIYRYVRAAWAKSNDDAKDLTQAFLAWIVEDEALKGYERERGSFRTFLKVLLRRFVGHQERALHRLKRGGGVKLVAFDDAALAEMNLPDPAAVDPEKTFDRAWVAEVVNRAVEKLRTQTRGTAREAAFRVYEIYELAPEGARPTYADIGRRLGLTVHQVEGHLGLMRDAAREAILGELSEMTEDGRQLEEEWNALFGG